MDMNKLKRLENFKKYKYGFFVHYAWGGFAYKVTLNPDGSIPGSLDEIANSFNPQKFAEDMESFGVEYVIFTLFHANMNLLCPCKAMDKWLPGHTSKRDLIGEIISALKKKGIEIILYMHPRDGHDLCEREMKMTGWGYGKSKKNGAANEAEPNSSTFKFEVWNDFINEIFEFVVNKYGADILGLYIDEASRGESDSVVDYVRLEKTIHQKYPHLLIIQNYYGNLYTFDIGDKEYSHWGAFESNDGNIWPCYEIPVASSVGSQFWTKVSKDKDACVFTPEALYRYTVLQASANSLGGGVHWAAGTYTDTTWEKGVYETMVKTYELIKPVEQAIKNTLPSTSFVTKPGATINMLEWGVATKSFDDKKEYLHFLLPPDSKTIAIEPPTDGKVFTSARLLPSKNQVTISQNAQGITLTLAENDEWSSVNTVIELTAY